MKSSKFNLYLQTLFYLTLTAVCFGQETNEKSAQRQISINAPIEGKIAAGETVKFGLRLKENQFAELLLEQKGVDLIIAANDAKTGVKLLEMNFNEDLFGGERFLAKSGAEPRDLLIRVFSADKKAGDFSLKLVELKIPEARDEFRIAAQTELLKGRELSAENKSESKERQRGFYQKALELARQSADRNLEATALLLLQASFREAGDKLKSIEYGKAALAALAGNQNGFDQVRAKIGIGDALVNMGEMKQGVEILSGALAEARKFGDRHLEISIFLGLGLGYQRQGEFEKALDYIEQARSAAKSIGDSSGQMNSLKLISRIQYDRGDFIKSVETFNKVLELAGDSNPEVKFPVYNELASNYVFLGQSQKALDLLQQSLAYYREVSGNKWNEGATLEQIAQIYSVLGQGARAAEYNRQATDIYTKLGYLDAIINANITKGEVYRAQKKFDSAKIAYLEALKLADPKGDKHIIAALYFLLGSTERRLGETQAALDHFVQAAKIRGEMKLVGMQSAALVQAADMFVILGQNDKAAAAAAQSLEISRALGDRVTESNALYHLARARRAQNQPGEALSLIADSIKIVESLRAELVSRTSRAAYFSTVRDKYDFYIELLIELGNQPEYKDFGSAAFAASERARARSLLDLLAESNTDVSAGISPELKLRETAIGAKISALQTQIIRLKSAENPNAARIATLQKEIEKADDERELLESEITKTNPRYANLKYPTTLDLAQTQKILDEKTVLLEYQIGVNASFLFAVVKNDFQIVRLPNDKIIRQTVETLRRSISIPSRTGLANYLAAGRELYQILLAPISALLKNKTKIVVAADGALHYLPFEVLLTGNQAASLDKLPYLVRDFEISYTPSASVLANLKNGSDTTLTPPAKSFLAFAAPDYGVKTAEQQAAGTRNTRAIFGDDRNWNLTDLKFARTEAERIASLFPAGQATVFTGSDATEERAESNDLLSRYRYLHFAVHGMIDEQQPQFSSLVLSLPKTVDQSSPGAKRESQIERDGLLQTPEIFNLRLRTDLVTLSACETGLGQELRGEGIVGLTRAFFYAGTPSVLVSLWKVDDASTAELMTLFYQQLRDDAGRDKSAALRRAQLKLIGENRFSHPFYWAPFILQGKTDSPPQAPNRKN